MVHDQQQPPTSLRPTTEVGHPHQRPRRQIQTPLQLLRRRFYPRPLLLLCQPTQLIVHEDRFLFLRHHRLLPASRTVAEAQPQRIVMDQQLLHRLRQHRRTDTCRHLQHQRLVVVFWLRPPLAQKMPLDRCQRQRSTHRPLLCCQPHCARACCRQWRQFRD